MMQEYVNPHYIIVIIVSSILKVIMVSIINRTEDDQTKIMDKDAKNKFKWSWLIGVLRGGGLAPPPPKIG